jgi:hypothetical protein
MHLGVHRDLLCLTVIGFKGHFHANMTVTSVIGGLHRLLWYDAMWIGNFC